MLRLIVWFLSAFALGELVERGPTAFTEYGAVEGFVDERTHVAIWFGIPYAAPPVADLRWRPPQQPKSWRPSTLSTKTHPKDCAQQGMDFFTPGLNNVNISKQSSEDCLYLNVYSSVDFQDQRKPVLLFIPGGAYQSGGTQNIIGSGEVAQAGQYDVELLHGNLVVVIVQYRLGLFGFAASDQLRSRDPKGGTGNYGILDQRLAMQWVKMNIAAFGGDSERVLLAGESAGGNSVIQHLVRKESWNLFSAAGISSGTYEGDGTELVGVTVPHNPGNVTVAMQEGNFQALMRSAGCSDVACMISLSANDLFAAAYSTQWNTGWAWPWVPVIDGVDLIDNPPALASFGTLAPVPVIVGGNKEDTSRIQYPACDPSNCTKSDFLSSLHEWGGLDDNQVQEALRLYQDEQPELTPKTHAFLNKWWAAQAHFWADSSVTCTNRNWARWVTKAGQNAYWYQLTHPVPEWFFPDDIEPDDHGVDVAVLFHFNVSNLPTLRGSFWQWTAAESRFSSAYVGYFASFAARQVPTGAVPWPAYNTSTEAALVMGSRITAQHHYLSAKCDFQDSIARPWVHPQEGNLAATSTGYYYLPAVALTVFFMGSLLLAAPRFRSSASSENKEALLTNTP